jgi:hypothetical protein
MKYMIVHRTVSSHPPPTKRPRKLSGVVAVDLSSIRDPYDGDDAEPPTQRRPNLAAAWAASMNNYPTVKE